MSVYINGTRQMVVDSMLYEFLITGIWLMACFNAFMWGFEKGRQYEIKRLLQKMDDAYKEMHDDSRSDHNVPKAD